MKKYVGTVIASLSLLTALPLAANADDTNTEKQTTAKIELTQDETNKDITLDNAPTFDFDSNVNLNTSHTYKAQTVTDKVHVTNPGNSEGWSVSVTGSDFNGTGDTSGALKGAKLSLNSGTVTPDDEANASTLPSTNNVDVNTSAQLVLTAGTGEGVGLYSLNYDADNVELYIPAGNVAGTYTSNLTWTLGNAPTGTTAKK
ncbi:WxL domain-containing protein [Lactiplantibacillus daowaiensis]|uniref:WxL domain-containing protein n=1 Tax=Lactiplantibacillus daowaiensis TaxID=2559918 RepID=A0ABW1S1M2_9LACO|nr:WxL domain-containing protein [Lactiplantibacillus daowaiensis]